MAKALIASAYGKRPDRSYFGGCSNGGRHTFVAMTRMPKEYDGYLAGAPGYRLPAGGHRQPVRGQAVRDVATDPSDLGTAFTSSERAAVSAAVLRPVRRPRWRRRRNDPGHDSVPGRLRLRSRRAHVRAAHRDGSCLSAAQKTAIAPIFSGAVDGNGERVLCELPVRQRPQQPDSSFWEFFVPLRIDSAATAMIWGVPPADPATFDGAAYALSTPIDTMLAAVAATERRYTESGLSFMQPVQPTNLAVLRGPRRQGHRLSRRERRHFLGQRHDEMVRGAPGRPTAATLRASRASSACPAWPIAAAGRRPTSSTC